MKTLIFTSTILLLLSCSTSTSLIIDGNSYKVYPPPGTIQVTENFYADEQEIGVIDYREFLFWTGTVYGYTSKEYQRILPDTTVWAHQEYTRLLTQSYFRHPVFDDHPIVGITLAQANIYTQWRTDRVAEGKLLNAKLIEYITEQTPENHFTVQRYIEGNYDWIIRKEDIILAEYKIPSIEEWEDLARGTSGHHLGTDTLSKHNQKLLKNTRFLYNTKERSDLKRKHEQVKEQSSYSIPFSPTTWASTLSKNVNGLYHMIGNVSELVEEGTAKGGSWKDKLADISIERNEQNQVPNCWTGFRNVCSYRLLKIQ